MALANCKDCGREVSTRARQCVHCGRPWPSAKCCPVFVTVLVAGLVALTAVGGVALVRSKCGKFRDCRIERSERPRQEVRFIEAEAPKAVEAQK